MINVKEIYNKPCSKNICLNISNKKKYLDSIPSEEIKDNDITNAVNNNHNNEYDYDDSEKLINKRNNKNKIKK
jgi:hypothetical protein